MTQPTILEGILLMESVFYWWSLQFGKHSNNKKVLLRERKRHTARRVESTPSVVLTGYPPAGYLHSRVPPWPGTLPGRVPPHQGTPPQLDLAGYPRHLPHGILGNVAKHYGIWVPPVCGLTNKVKLLPSRRTTYAGGKNTKVQCWIMRYWLFY